MSLRRGALWFAAGLLLALVAGALAMVSLQRAVNTAGKPVETPVQPALVAARAIPLHTVLTANDFRLVTVPRSLAPKDAATDPEQALGKLSTVEFAEGEILLTQRLVEPDYVGPNAAWVMDPEQVIVALPTTSLLGSLQVIRPGDRVDIMYSQDLEIREGVPAGANTLDVLQDVRVAAVIPGDQANAQGQAPAAILLALDPQDALVLKYFRDQGGIEDLALRSPAAERGDFDVTPVDGEYVSRRYGIRPQAER